MSGGSHDYVYIKIEDELCGKMHDAELNDLIEDIAGLAHDLEWWKSGDTCEDDYREAVRRFKHKWFNHPRDERLKKYVDYSLESTRAELYKMIETGNGGTKRK